MLDNLLEIEVAYSMLKGGDEGEDPIDAHYKKLKTEMEVCKNHSKITKLLKNVLKFHHLYKICNYIREGPQKICVIIINSLVCFTSISYSFLAFG